MLKPLQKSWRSRGIPIAIFLDDGLGGGIDKLSAKIHSLAVHSDLLKSGFVPNQEKSVWEPVQVLTWLGVVLNTIDGSVQATDERIVKLTSDLGSLQALSSQQSVCKVHVKSVASVAGQIISLSSCVGSVTRIMTRHLFSVVNSALSWDSEVFLSEDSISEINFWANNVDSLNGRVYWGVLSLPFRVSFSDASDSACGAFVESHSELVFHQNWSPEEKVKSSTWRELKAVCLALEAFAGRLSNTRVIWYSDNQNVESILLNGSRKLDLQALALEAFQICLKYRISLDARWIPRDLNVRADSISKIVDFDDYAINDSIFRSINDYWGPHTVDRFACSYNSKLPRFNSRFFQPGCEAVDAFSQDWGYDNNWLCPPVCLIVRVLKHMEVCLARDIFQSGFWDFDQDALPNGPVQGLADRLKTTVLSSKATSTSLLYYRAYRKWKQFAISMFDGNVFPAKPFHVALYLQHLIEQSHSPSVIDSAFYGIKWAHSMAGIPSPTDNPIVEATRSASKRLLGTAIVNRKEPVSSSVIHDIISRSNLDNPVELRNITLYILSFAGFFRFDDVSRIRRNDVFFNEGFVVIKVPKSKNDQLRRGDEVVISELPSGACPVKLLKRYLSKFQIPPDSRDLIFRPISKGKDSCKLIAPDRPISYSTMREAFRRDLKAIGADPSKFGLHSLRSGGATMAANSGVSDRVFQRHGRWKSVQAKDTYVDDDLDQRLSVSKFLGL
ncbi:uncharacterized protein [Montipora capricornis]|uniref:uncharacterized protein n=1 Tax=Montipora capricornis TaxID=246305 RepID=UPI0035F1B27A